MTDTTTTIDTDRIVDLIDQYHQTANRAEQREIENDVLAETVWRDPPTEAKDEFHISREDVELIYSELPEEATEAKRVLRALYID